MAGAEGCGFPFECVALDAQEVDTGGQGEIGEDGQEVFVWKGRFVQNAVKTLLDFFRVVRIFPKNHD